MAQEWGAAASGHRSRGEGHGWGWVIYAGVIMLIASVVNVMFGIAAIAGSSFYVSETRFVIGSLNTWGWFLTILGALQFFIAFGVLLRLEWARWTGILLTAVNAIVLLLFLPAYPFIALSAFVLDVLVIYGLVAHGRWTAEGS
jgi:hypothetical protein